MNRAGGFEDDFGIGILEKYGDLFESAFAERYHRG